MRLSECRTFVTSARLRIVTQPADLAAPVFVRVRAVDGAWATSVFDQLPEAGEAMFAPYGGDGTVTPHPISDYPAASPDGG